MKVSIAVPVYQNQRSLSELYRRLTLVATELPRAEFEFVFVDDGSSDDSFTVLKDLATQDQRVKAIKLSRNFGSSIALAAALSYVQGDCTVVIAADLQDPPELIPEMLSKWSEGDRIVIAARSARHDPLASRLSSNLFNWLYHRFVFSNFPSKGFDFFLVDRRVVRVLVNSAERNTYLMGLLLWTGFRTATICYTRQERPYGKSQWTIGKKIKYFFDAFVGFSYLPLRLSSLLGIVLALLGFAYAGIVLIGKLVAGFPVEGWASLMVITLLVSGTQLVMLGILGEYVWRNLDETRHRPLFVVDEMIGVTQLRTESPKRQNLSKEEDW